MRAPRYSRGGYYRLNTDKYFDVRKAYPSICLRRETAGNEGPSFVFAQIFSHFSLAAARCRGAFVTILWLNSHKGAVVPLFPHWLMRGGGGAAPIGQQNSVSVFAHTVPHVQAQGSLRQTTSPLDFTLDGKGFFLVKKRAGHVSGSSSEAPSSGSSSGSEAANPLGCLRTGSFHFDKDGVLVNSQGFSPQGWACNADGIIAQAKTLGSVEAVRLSSAAETSATPSTTPSEPPPPSFVTESTEAGTYNLHWSRELYRDDRFSEISIEVLRDSEGTEHKVWVEMHFYPGEKNAYISFILMDDSSYPYIGLTPCTLDDSGYVVGFDYTSIGSADGSKLICSIPDSGATLTFDCSDVRMVVKDEARGDVKDQTVTWPGPVYLSDPEEGGDTLDLDRVGSSSCSLYLRIFRSEDGKGYSGVVRADYNYRAELNLDAYSRVMGYTIKECPDNQKLGYHSGSILPISVADGTFDFDLRQLQVAGVERPNTATSFSISDDGMLMASFEDGSVRPLYQLALATCPAPDKMTEKSGGFYVPTSDSGELMVGTSGENGFGTVVSGALESSTTDIAQTLAVMIELQSAYAANTQVIASISKMLDMLMKV